MAETTHEEREAWRHDLEEQVAYGRAPAFPLRLLKDFAAQQRDIEALREALEPFAEIAAEIPDTKYYAENWSVGIAEIRRAASVFATMSESETKDDTSRT